MSEKSIFTSHKFSCPKQELLYKRQMIDGLGDKTLPRFVPLAFSVIAKQEYKQEKAEDNFINSFLESAKILAKISQEKSSPIPGIYLIYEHSLALPILYMTRHCMELSIKKAIRRGGHNPKHTHKLEGLWNSFVSYLSKERSTNDEKTLKQMHEFVKHIDFLDDNGEKLRYPKSKDDQFTQNTFYWVNCVAITETLGFFVNQLNALTNINEDNINEHTNGNDVPKI